MRWCRRDSTLMSLRLTRQKTQGWPELAHGKLPYERTSLNSSLNQIRFLALLPGMSHNRICCKIEVVRLNLSQPPDTLKTWATPYEALSYPLGSEVPGKKMRLYAFRKGFELAAADVSATRNLFNALQALRWEHHARWLRMDALSVDQDNGLEKISRNSADG